MWKTIRSSRRATLFGMAALVLMSLGLAQPASADPLDGPRAQGLVGERFDGFAVVRDPNAGASVKALVKDINAKRRSFYESVAKEQNTSVLAVGKIYANKILEKAPKGYWFLTDTGAWRQK